MPAFLFLFLCAACGAPAAKPVTPAAAAATDTPQVPVNPAGNTIADRFAVPTGFRRLPAADGSFGAWLRQLELQPEGSEVHLYNGARKRRPVWAAVLRMDVGDRDLQQCADAVMRLRAEWLYAAGRRKEISFNLTDGTPAPYSSWMAGKRLHSSGNRAFWRQEAAAGDSYASFRRYLDAVFTWAGTLSLAKSLKPKAASEIAPGDVFIRGGSPGHAVIVMDVIVNDRGERRFLIAQSYMPAQEIHILLNYGDAALSPWYSNRLNGLLDTPEWTFAEKELKTW